MSPRPLRRGRLRLVRGAPPSASPEAPRGFAGVSRAAAASLLVPGLGQFLQGRRIAGLVHLVAAIAIYPANLRLKALGVPPLAALLLLALLSAADAARAERLARRPSLRVV